MEIFVTKKDLIEYLKKSHPEWTAEYDAQKAETILLTLDPRLMPVLSALIHEHRQKDFTHGEFSVYFIQALWNHCDYLDAILLMNDYLQDPIHGKAEIIKR